MEAHQWVQEFPGAITICDPQGVIIEMNDKAAATFQKSGGRQLLGSNLFDCHPEPARSKLKQLMERRETNVYTIEKKGIKKLIYQTPWYVNGQYRGFMEMAVELPATIPHFVRDASL
ncbi:MAG TPA: PAS domain-containing protein [Thermodesulfovibrionales bacterium]|nr:PAS domain-containing protein [Thermodesulfovibrionales bacterium]